MKSTIRCCISCILPCGSLDVIRIIHSNGHVEEISGSITAAQFLKLHPKHVLKKPSSPPSDESAGAVPRIVTVPPNAELRRGKIYFLIPAPSDQKPRPRGSRRKKRDPTSAVATNNNSEPTSDRDLIGSDRYLSEILSEKVSTQRDRRRGRVGVWRPHLESISETPVE